MLIGACIGRTANSHMYEWPVKISQDYCQLLFITHECLIKTHCRVLAAKKDTGDTHELFTGTIKALISAPLISKTTGSIFIKFTYFILYDLTYVY